MTHTHAVLAVGLAVALLTLVGGATNARAQDLANYCSGPVPPATVLLVDQTEAFDATDRKRFADGMDTFFRQLRPGQVVDIYPIGETASVLASVFSMCVPGCADEIEPGSKNWKTICSRLRIQRDKRLFQRAFVEKMRELLNSSTKANGTAILGTLEQLNIQYPNGQLVNLTIFSDMLEFTPPEYRANNPFSNFVINAFDDEAAEQLLRRARGPLEAATAFRGAEVVVFGIGKRLGRKTLIDQDKSITEVELPQPASRAFLDFWRKLFTTVLGVREDRLLMTLNY